MSEIEECIFNNVKVKFYDGIDVEYASEYNGDDMLVFFIDSWEKYKRDSIINGILCNNDIFIDKLNNNKIAIYQTNGYLMEVFISIKNKMSREYSGTWNIIAKK